MKSSEFSIAFFTQEEQILARSQTQDLTIICYTTEWKVNQKAYYLFTGFDITDRILSVMIHKSILTRTHRDISVLEKQSLGAPCSLSRKSMRLLILVL